MRAQFSEFSYGIALTNELNSWYGGLTAAPLFPSTRAEGNLGYDAKLHLAGIPLFLQFKLSECITVRRQNIPEVRNLSWDAPFYRMHLRATGSSRQHDLLRALEAQGEEVYYAAPLFYTSAKFDEAFVKSGVEACSAFIAPSSIGELPDKGPHHVALTPDAASAYVFSSPKPVAVVRGFEKVADRLHSRLERQGRPASSKDVLEQLAFKLETTVREAYLETPQEEEGDGEAGDASAPLVTVVQEARLNALWGNLSAAARVAHVAQTYLDAQVYWVTRRSP